MNRTMISGRPNEPIAIIGSACRFAGDLNTPSKLWELLQEPHDIRQEVPPDRFSLRGFYHPDGTHHGHANVSHAYFINEDLTAFDAEFFSIKPAEAKAMDPQQRLLMEVVYEGLESAGIPMSQLHGSDTGVYVGVMFDDYGAQLLRDLQMVPTYYATGTSRAVLANRLSYFFDWRGPSISVDTACSSSLVAVHMAVQALRAGESRVALACGSNLILGPESFIIESKLNMLSPDGISRMWDEGANGYARGEGVAAVVLKTLSDAIQDGDHIECVIRETALNQNGRTAKGGITVPSASAQEDLIRTTYAKAGLDLDTPNDRPQYFEAHGTGTPAGDPLEAEAVYNTFIKGAPSVDGVASKNPLYVGSVKTVIGHTEGTAGIAALLKVSQSIQRGVISPNLHFDQLSHRVAPFYKGVEVLKTAVPWPDTAGVSRRASVNSFGFGGSNAHAILEQYVPAPDGLGDETAGSSSCIHDTSHTILSPFVFSASSESSLRQSLTAHMISLETSAHHFPLNNFAWTLRQRRSILSYRAAFSAHCAEDLQSKLRASLEISPTVGCKVLGTGRILGVFTGQGAQYKRMGAELIETSEFARKTIQQLDRYLADTPGNDGPAWSLETEILTSNTRVYGAEISQPVCTAIQILLVDLLRIGGIRFEAVVGHSSGEIAAAYAAGFMTARDAIQIAYYRGLHTRLSSSPNGSHIQGAMMAVASSVEDVVELCADKLFTDRITIAAYNSSSSVTVSGDVDAIEDLGFVLDDEKKYNRRLEVDKAYHSAHMSPCEEPYTESLRRCGIQPQAADRQSCAWYSSVYDRRIDTDISGTLRDSYWVDNMTKPVLFMQAISRALADYPCDIALEIGPHPALKGPASQTIQEVLERNIPYHGTLDRKMGSAEAVSTMMGFLWSNLPETKVDLQNWKNVMAGDQPQSYDLITNLPPYQWNHQTQYWHESRSSRRMRLREQAHHPLLGHPTTDSSPHHMCWRNLLRLNEMKWLRGHQVQGQVIFPAAGYVSSALEAGRLLTRESNQCIRLIEVKDFIIHQAVAFDHENAEIEVLISMGDIQRGPLRIQAQFTYSAALASHDAEDLTLAASGNLEILLGESDPSLLPVRKPTLPFLIDVETNRFYAALADLGYEFGDRFCSLSGLMRKRNRSTCLARLHPPDYGEEGLLIHPTELDATLQSVILAHSYPYDEQLRTLHLPTKISHIRVNPALCSVRNRRHGETASMDASIEPGQPGQRGVTGFVDLYFNHSPHAAIQIQGANFMPLGRASTEKDRKVFSKVHWINSKPNGLEAAKDIILTETHRETVRLLERISTFYLRQFDREVPHDHPKRSEYPTNCYLNYARYVTEMVETGRHTWAEEEWRYDTIDRIMELSKPFSHLPDVEIMHLVGSQMPRVFGGKTTMLEEFRADGNDILDRYYSSGFGLKESAQWVARSVKQIVDRYPHMNILEAGAGTGGATKAIFKDIDRSFRSYTYTDISAGFFNNASSIFSKQRDQMVFKTFDAERSPADQGFVEGSYDLVIAFFIIHATKDLECTMRNIRKLLKPGGYLVVGEGQEGIKCIASSGFIFGTLPGWWLGTQNGRILSPHVSPERWDELLKDTGFSGTDSTSPKDMQDTLNVFHFVAQAVDEPVKFLRTPLAPSSWQIPPIEKLVLVGGGTTIISAFVDKLKGTLKNTRYVAEVFQFETLMDVDYEMIDSHTMVVSLTELDKPMFKDITEDSFESLKKMFESEKTLLWITSGRLDDEPYSNMTVGFGRTASNEVADLRLQQLDITDLEFTSPELLAEIILRFYGSGFLPIDVLWTVEPEIVIDNEQRQLLSRLRPIQEMNDRYNSGHRPVVRETSSKNAHFSLQSSPSGYSIVELSNDDNQMLDQGCADLLVLRTMHSVLSAIKTRLGHKFLILGEDLKTSERYLALTASLDSVTRVPRGAAVACSQLDDISNEELITSAASHVVVMAGFHDLYHGQTVIAHNATKVMADALAIQAAANNIDVVYTTDIADEELPDNWLKLPQYLTGADAKEILSLWEPSGFLGFSNEDSQGSANEVTMISVIQHSCQNIQMAKSMYSLVGQISSSSDNGLLAQTLRQCLAFVKLHLKYGVHHQPTSTPSITLGALVRNPPPVVDNFSIIDWVSDTSLPLQVARLDSKPIFKGISGTYWIVGMSGALGISLIDWMVSRGAKYVVLSSRAPMVAPEWITAHARKGAKVIVMPW